MAERIVADLLANIENSLKSDKINNSGPMLADFRVLTSRKDFDPELFKVPFLVRVKNTKVELANAQILSRIDVIWAALAPYSAMPGIVQNEGVISIDASRSIPAED